MKLFMTVLALALSVPAVAQQQVILAPVWGAGITYSYDGAGNITRMGTDIHVYDAAGRMIQSDTNGVRRSFSYDAHGNRLGCSGSGDCQYGRTISSATNRINDAGYDLRGNLTAFEGHTYTYDAVNMQVRDTDGAGRVREYVYTADDERIAVYTAGSWQWSLRDASGKVLREMTSADPGAGGTVGTASWVWAKDYVHRNGLLLASRQVEPGAASPSTYHYHLDHLGTPRRITDDRGRIVGAHSYHSFGSETTDADRKDEPIRSRLKYTGHERDGDLDYMHARYYDSRMGRFLSVDPHMEPRRNLATPQRWNRYSYALNNPLKYTDPNGRKDRIFVLSMLSPDMTPNIERSLNRAVAGTRFEGRVTVYGPDASPATVRAYVRLADNADMVGLLVHSGPNPANRGGTMMGGGRLADSTTAITGNTLAKWANDGSAPTLIIAGCNSNWCAQTVSKATGATTFGTDARTNASEEMKGMVSIMGSLAHGASPEQAAAAGSAHIETLPPCRESNPTCNGDRTTPAEFKANANPPL